MNTFYIQHFEHLLILYILLALYQNIDHYYIAIVTTSMILFIYT